MGSEATEMFGIMSMAAAVGALRVQKWEEEVRKKVLSEDQKQIANVFLKGRNSPLSRSLLVEVCLYFPSFTSCATEHCKSESSGYSSRSEYVVITSVSWTIMKEKGSRAPPSSVSAARAVLYCLSVRVRMHHS